MALNLDQQGIEEAMMHPEACPALYVSGGSPDWRMASSNAVDVAVVNPEVYAILDGLFAGFGDVDMLLEDSAERKAYLEPFVSRVLQLDIDSKNAFAHHFSVRVMREFRASLDGVKTFPTDVEAVGALNGFSEFLLSLRQPISYINVFSSFQNLLSGDSSFDALREAYNSLNHDVADDLLGMNAYVSAVVLLLRHGAEHQMLTKDHLKWYLSVRDSKLDLLSGIAEADAGIIERKPCLKNHCVLESLRSIGVVCANRFFGEFFVNGEKVFDSDMYGLGNPCKDIVLEFVGDEAVVAMVDESMIKVLVYNLIKNSVKSAILNGLSGGKVIVEVVLSDDGCLVINVKDSGMGLSYDELRDHHTEIALRKETEGGPLSLLEELLLDEYWRDLVTPRVLNRQLLNRGESLHGGTGVGLDLARTIVEDLHHGLFRIYDHPRMGACVQILLPNTDSTDEVTRRAITKKHQAKEAASLAV